MKQDLRRTESLVFLVHEVARLFRRRFEEDAKLHGFTLPQWRALAEIFQNEGISQVALAAILDVDQMTVSGIVSRLEKRGLIERYPSPNDSRAKLARLTPEGRELITRAKNVGRVVHEKALDGLSEAERIELKAGLALVRDNLHAMTIQKETA